LVPLGSLPLPLALALPFTIPLTLAFTIPVFGQMWL
jgi:hypothetical protein